MKNENKKTKNLSVQKAILNLSKSAEKEQRDYGFTKNKRYIRPLLAGAYFIGDETMICNGFWGVIFNGRIEGLQMIPDYQKQADWGFCYDLHRAFSNDTIRATKKDEFEFNVVDLKSKLKVLKANNEDLTIKINSATYNLNILIKLVECFENCKIYNNATNNISQLILEGSNGIGVLLPLRPQAN